MTINISIKQLPHGKDLNLPAYATSHSAGMDLMAAIDKDIILKKGHRVLVPAGIAIALPDGHEAQIRPRSGLALKNGITVLNTPGTIDADYRGEIGVVLINLGEEDFNITRGMRIAQMIIAPYVQAKMNLVDDLDETTRGQGGFGSTGV
ncbi:MAG: dUTP diphosphatase [Rickettsiales bacterium]